MISTTLAAMAASSLTFFSDLPKGEPAYLLDESAVCMRDKQLVLKKDAAVTTNARYAYLLRNQSFVMSKDGDIHYSAGVLGAGATDDERLAVLGNLTETITRSCDPNSEYVEITGFGEFETIDDYINGLLPE